MKPIAEAFPNVTHEHEDGWVEFNHPGYDELVISMGVEILVSRNTKDYQGDYVMLLREGTKYGYLMFGFGSCSGCDALQACETIAALEELRTSLYSKIRWEESIEDMIGFLESHNWEYDYCGRNLGPVFLEAIKTWVIGREHDELKKLVGELLALYEETVTNADLVESLWYARLGSVIDRIRELIK